MNATEDGQPVGEAPDLPGRGRKVYIAGPMTGLPGFNYPAFHAKAAELRAQGYEVRNPAENDSGSSGKPWEFYMRLALKQLLECDEIYLLPGSHNSRGARIEKNLAEELGMTIRGALQ